MINFFKLFAIKEDFNIDTNILDKNYFDLQSQFHPDLNRFNSFQMDSNTINLGYNILKDDFERAAHLLDINGINIKQDSCPIKLMPQELDEILEHIEHNSFSKDLINDIKSQMSVSFLSKDLEKAALLTLKLRFLTKTYNK
jgi:molecular chaperone HscB